MSNPPINPSTPQGNVSFVPSNYVPPNDVLPITPLNARVARVEDINIDPLIKNPLPPQNQQVEFGGPVNLFGNGDFDNTGNPQNSGFGGRKRSSKKHRRGKKAKRTNKKTRRFFRFGGMDPFMTPPSSPIRVPPPVIRAPRVNQLAPAGVFQGQNLMAQFNAVDNRDEEGYTDSEDMSGGADKRPRSYTRSSENGRVAKKPKYPSRENSSTENSSRENSSTENSSRENSSTENSSRENSSTETINSISSSSLGSLTTHFGETNITSSTSSDEDMSATNGNTKGGYRRKTKRRTSRKRRTTRK